MGIGRAYALATAWGFALLLATSGFAKLHRRARLMAALEGYGLMGRRWYGLLAWVLPLLELIIACLLLLPPRRELGLLLAGMLMVAYSGIVAVALARGRAGMDCGCGSLEVPLCGRLLVRNVVLAGLALVGFRLSSPTQAAGLTELAFTAALLIVAVIVYGEVNDRIRADFEND